MKLSEYIENLINTFEQEGDIDCYYAKDDEGNGYQEIGYEPSIMYRRVEDDNRELTCLEDIKEMIEDGEFDSDEVNKYFNKVICVN